MRIASLVPSATEALFALGLGEQVVAVTHECDFPPAARVLPRLTRSVIPPGLEPGEVDRRVRDLTGRGEGLYELDEATLADLAPDLIVTQALCAVCAVSYEDVRAVAGRLPSRPAVRSLDPETLEEVFDGMVVLAEAAGEAERGERLRDELSARVTAVGEAVAAEPRARVAALEWLDPPFAGGHWVPDVVAAAGGEDVLAAPGQRSREVAWEEVAAARPDVVCVMPCGLYVDEAAEQARAFAPQLGALDAKRIVAVDAAASFSRPGPRLADGVELLAHVLHPRAVAPPRELSHRDLAGAWVSS